jgi:ribosome maturation protein Sdo1
MIESEKIFIATKYSDKGYNYEQLCYGDELYNYKSDVRDKLANDIWDYVIEYKEIGSIAFKEKYKGNKFY